MRFRLTSFVVFPLTLTATVLASQTQTRPVTVPFELANRHIVLKARVNSSRPLAFILDTGADQAIVMTTVATELGLKTSGTVMVGGAGAGQQAGALVQNATWALDELKGFDQPVAMALPLMQLSTGMGQDIDGIVGTTFIKQFVLEVDYQTRTITFHNRDTFTYAGKGESIPIEFYRAHPTVSATVTSIGGQPITRRFVLDLGSSMALALHSPFVKENGLLGAQAKTVKLIGAGGAGGSVTGQVGRVESLQIGSYQLSQVLTVFTEDTAGAFADPNLAGNIGMQVATRFKVFLDYSRNRIILEPSAAFRDPFGVASPGMAVRTEGDHHTFRVKEVLENSPASDAGIKAGDLITTVNGTPVGQLTLSKLIEMFEKPLTYELTIKRAGVEDDIRLRLTPRKIV